MTVALDNTVCPRTGLIDLLCSASIMSVRIAYVKGKEKLYMKMAAHHEHSNLFRGLSYALHPSHSIFSGIIML